MTAKTRRQKAAFTNQTDEIDSVPSTNGTVDTKKSNKSGSPAAAQGNVKENVFLFAPNLIGTKRALSFSFSYRWTCFSFSTKTKKWLILF